MAESFENVEKNDYPMAFKVNKVDEMTNIYHFYNDAYYDEFINKANEIFNKYNETCSRENLNLVLESDKCVFTDDEFAHGGYKCDDTGHWSTECQKSYCEFGFFYNKATGKCELDKCLFDEIIEIKEETVKTIEIEPEKSYFINLNTSLYTYFFSSPVDNIMTQSNFKECPRFCAVKKNVDYMYINYYRKLDSSVNITITSKKVDLNIESEKINSPKFSGIREMIGNKFFIFQINEPNYMYIDSFDKSSRFYYAKYDDNMTPDDIINMNEQYFKEGLDQFLYLPKDGIYIGAFLQDLAFVKVYFYNSLPEVINLANGDKNILFLQKDMTYQLNFTENKMPFQIRLNEKTDATFDIKVEGQSEKIPISLTNKYFTPTTQPYNGIIEINNIQTTSDLEGALIEILFAEEEGKFELIDGEVTDHIITKDLTLIEFNPPENKKIINIFFESKEQFIFDVYGGFSKDKYFYFSEDYLKGDYYYPMLKYNIKLDNPLKDKQLEQGEKYYIFLIGIKLQQDQEINLTVKYENNPIENLYEIIDESYAKDVISNLTSIIEYGYIYNDIVKNPPEPEGLNNYVHDAINFTKALNDIETKDRKFYDFYRDIREILGTPRDLHFRFYGLNTPSGIKFDKVIACLPFSFYVDKDEKNETKVFIKYFHDCADFFSEKIKQYVKEKAENKIPLEKINKQDPFDYIQNWGRKYEGNKSPHAHFTLIKRVIFLFNLNVYPYKPEELKMEFKFEGDIVPLDLDYYIYFPKPNSPNNLLGANNLSQEEFDEFYENEMKLHKKEYYIPNIFEMIKKYKKSKGILFEEEKEENAIEWDYATSDERGLKCRVDKNNELNIMLQETFMFKNPEEAQEVIYQCAKKFHENDYKVVIIENFNGGGLAVFSYAIAQAIQVKILNRAYLSIKPLEILRVDYENDPEMFYDIETCKAFRSFDDFLEGPIDDYSKGTQEIKHHRTKVTDFLDINLRKTMGYYRQELAQGNLKKPTDIIVFTDSFAYSATSLFIKTLQNEGGAITVGFNGNPKLGKDLFDASQSPSPVLIYEFTPEYNNLKSLGIEIQGITFGETFEEDYDKKNPTPREYLVDPVDEISDIYEPYSDDTDDQFIAEAKKFFNKYNKNQQCNPNNTNLLFEPENECYNFPDDKYAHGGYPCGSDGTWDKSACKKFYCDYGYYYSKIEDKCLPDLCTNDPNTKEITLNGEYNETIIINKENNYEYVFTINNSDYIYMFLATEPGFMQYAVNNPCPSHICVLQKDVPNHKNILYINYFRDIGDKNVIIKIIPMKGFPGIMQSFVASNLVTQGIQTFPQMVILIAETKVDYVFYFKSFDDGANKVYAELPKNISSQEEIDISITGKNLENEIVEAKAGKLYVFYYMSQVPGKLFQMMIQPKITQTNFVVSENIGPLEFYFTKDLGEYTIDFANNIYERVIQLSKATIDSEITIKDLATQKEIILNSTNSYYSFDNRNGIFKGKLSVKVTKGDSTILEFLFVPQVQYEIINEKEFIERKISKPAIIKFDKNTKDLNTKITIKTKSGNNFEYTFLTYYSKNDYTSYPIDLNPTISGSNKYELEIYNKEMNLENGESFCLIIYFNRTIFETEEILISKKEDERYPIFELYQLVSYDYMINVTDNILSLLDSFVFSDIMKNPPAPYDQYKVDIKKVFDTIKSKAYGNRPFYDFYRDIKKALSLYKDANLDILGGKLNTRRGIINFDDYRMCLPFKFYLDNDKNKEVKMYIKEYPFCSKYFDEKTRNAIKHNETVPLKEINGTNPFEFIQKFSNEFYSMKNMDSQFSNMLDVINDNNLVFQPLTPWQLNYINLTFEDDTVLETHFHVIKTKEEDLNPSNKKEEIKEGEITWDHETEGGELKCRVDKTKHLNVLFFNSFYVEKSGSITIYKCAKLFYSNDYKIVIITSQLWEGDTINSYIYTQLLFPKIDVKFNMAMKQTELTKQLFLDNQNEFLDAQTCSAFNSWEDFIEPKPDDYSSVKHYRTKIFNRVPEKWIEELHEIRKEFKNLGYPKKSTDIIILTDTVNYGSASFFIKTIQNNGGAILASYAGNPQTEKISNEELDASLDPVYSTLFENTDKYKALKERGFVIYNIPYAEAYENVKENDYPMAFKVNKVDEMTNIYHFYDDAYYDEFINKANEIFDKYNETCSRENLNLVLESDECIFENDTYAHGGYSCGTDKKWGTDNTTCKKSYCDIGYYYDKTQDKCVNDYCTNDPNVKKIELNDTYNVTITINQENNIKYILNLNTTEYVYFFESNEPGFMHYEVDDPCPSFICVLDPKVDNHNNKILLNNFKNASIEVKIKITSLKNLPGSFMALVVTNEETQRIISFNKQLMAISESLVDYIYFFKTFDEKSKMFYTEYKKEINIDDIITLNKNYFKEITNQIIEAPKDKTYLLTVVTENLKSLVQPFMQPKLREKDIAISEKIVPRLIYFSEDIDEYTLDYTNSIYDSILHLSKLTKDSEITIKDLATQKETILNSTNSYYTFDNQNSIFKGKLSIKVTKGNKALLESLFAPTDFEIMNEKEYTSQKISKSPIIKFDKNTKNKNINITISTKSGNNFGYSYLTYYSKNNYISSQEVIEPTFTGANSYTLTINNKEENLGKDETFSLVKRY